MRWEADGVEGAAYERMLHLSKQRDLETGSDQPARVNHVR
jgi:hypothetical protein